MKKIISCIFLILAINLSFAQNSIQKLVDEGIVHHDNGNYDKAIETYKKALKIDPKSELVNYEIALTYFYKGDYKKAIKHSDVVLKQNAKLMVQAYITKGSALDLQGKTKQSIKLFEYAIETSPNNYLLHFNLAVNHFKIINYDKAEKHFIRAIELNSNHTSSHLLLAHLNNNKNKKAKAVMAAHYFLLLEPNSMRSPEAFQILKSNIEGNVTQEEGKPNTINIVLNLDEEDEFSSVDLMISLLTATKSVEENKDKTEDEMFVENTKKLFLMLGEMKKEEKEGIWWNLYTPFFYDLANSEHIETYCKYISQVANENSVKWLEENNDKLEKFDEWLQVH